MRLLGPDDTDDRCTCAIELLESGVDQLHHFARRNLNELEPSQLPINEHSQIWAIFDAKACENMSRRLKVGAQRTSYAQLCRRWIGPTHCRTKWGRWGRTQYSLRILSGTSLAPQFAVKVSVRTEQ